MGTDYNKQFDEAHEVLETVQSDGFQTLIKSIEAEITSIEVEVERAQNEMLEAVRKGGVDSERFVQNIVRCNAKLEGLRFITSQVSFFERKKEQAVKHL